ncbi:TetR/AcrR family transcriptional regulator [Halobacillus salinarum]|uniref:TetR/AcrR family transcriptional regulator n=1 Tax=Halobacillus salinarum TaxID=2932257 RepID=A0ABY4EGI4_9BACI|nr:TetR family transcriptional regulator [Halobacillus salinarum]UOQ43583.1 TetR/AcrR family transcriptional regulator [Halobacillus salinarum]
MSVQRKEEILQAARHSFEAFGYKATTMDHVAKAANVGKGTIYNFFKNKEELFHEIITDLLKEMKWKAESVMDDQRSFKENVHLALYELLEYRRTNQLMVKLIQEGKEIGTGTVKKALIHEEGLIINYLQDQVSKAVKKGDIRSCDPEMTAFIMYKLYTAFTIEWEALHEPLPKEKVAKYFDEYLFKGLSPS